MTLTLIFTAPQDGQLDKGRLGQCLAPLPAAHRGAIRWLAKDRACALPVFPWDGDGNASLWHDDNGFRDYLESAVLQPARETLDAALIAGTPPAKKRLLISDMDSTMIEQECIDELAAFAGIKDQVSAITQRAMNGELDFSAALKERVALLAGLSENVLQEVIDKAITPMPGARTLVQTMKAAGAHCILVSGGFTFFTARVAALIGFDAHFANVLEIENGVLTGRVVEPVLGAEAKLDTLNRVLKDRGLDRNDVLAVGDGANDALMVEAAGLGVAFRPHPVLARRADAVIRHGDLTALLHLQGYTSNEMAAV